MTDSELIWFYDEVLWLSRHSTDMHTFLDITVQGLLHWSKASQWWSSDSRLTLNPPLNQHLFSWPSWSGWIWSSTTYLLCKSLLSSKQKRHSLCACHCQPFSWELHQKPSHSHLCSPGWSTKKTWVWLSRGHSIWIMKCLFNINYYIEGQESTPRALAVVASHG